MWFTTSIASDSRTIAEVKAFETRPENEGGSDDQAAQEWHAKWLSLPTFLYLVCAPSTGYRTSTNRDILIFLKVTPHRRTGLGRLSVRLQRKRAHFGARPFDLSDSGTSLGYPATDSGVTNDGDALTCAYETVPVVSSIPGDEANRAQHARSMTVLQRLWSMGHPAPRNQQVVDLGDVP
jgi:hypothetical protein